MNQSVPGQLARIGLVTSDALRVLGLQTILGHGNAYEVVKLDGLDDQAGSVGVVVIDSTTTDHVFELLIMIQRMHPEAGLIVLGVSADLDYVASVIGAGARGYLNLSSGEDEVRQAIEVVLDGSIWAPRKVLAKLVQRGRQASADSEVGVVSFTRREHQVLDLLVLGQPNREIASTLGVDEGTIKAHMGRLMRKAGVDNRTALSMRALERSWTSKG